MRTKTLYILFIFPIILASCVKEEIFSQGVEYGYTVPVDPDVITPGIAVSSDNSNGFDVLSFSVVAEGSSAATKAARMERGEASDFTCEVNLLDVKAGDNCMTSYAGTGTKSLVDNNSGDTVSCNFLRLDELTDTTFHTALYSFPTWSEAKLLEADLVGAPDNSSQRYRSIALYPEQKYNMFDSLIKPKTIKDSIFYHTRMVGWSPMLCNLPSSGKPTNFGAATYTNYCALLGGKYAVVFNCALDGQTDLMMTDLREAQRWHADNGSYHKDLQGQQDETYSLPFGVNSDQVPTYSNPFTFKHYLSAVRIWAKLDQSASATATDTSYLNISTWGHIESLLFVDQPMTCTIFIPDSLNHHTDSVMAGSWSDFTNFNAGTDYMFGSADYTHNVEDRTVTYPIDMTQYVANMTDSTYLGYALVQPDKDIIIAISTTAGTYQATLPHRVKINGDSVSVFKQGKIYDVVLNLETKGTVSDFIENEDTGTYEDLSPYSISEETFKTANCYIVNYDTVAARIGRDSQNAPGFCFLATTIGNGQNGIMSRGITTFHTTSGTIDTPADAKVIWQSESGLVSNVHLQHGYIRFQVPKARMGNAVIAALDNSGNVVWSWHIWITKTPSDIEAATYQFMDRNLGAITDGAVVPTSDDAARDLYGLYYQWGRKDPLPGPRKYDQTSGQTMRIDTVYNTYNEPITSLGMYIYNQAESIEDGIRYPMHYLICRSGIYYNFDWISSKVDFLWGKESEDANHNISFDKSIYDPCPYGYHVPMEELQYLVETASERDSLKYGMKYDGVFLPYSGFYGPDRNQSANDGSAYYCGEKGDYQSAEICNDEDGVDYSPVRYHRLRTYITRDSTWVERNTDGKSNFQYDSRRHYVLLDTVRSHHDYTNRRTAASVRCVKISNYPVKISNVLQVNTQKVSLSNNTTVRFTFDANTTKGNIDSAVLNIFGKGDPNYRIKLSSGTSSSQNINLLSHKLNGWYDYTVQPADLNLSADTTLYARLIMTVSQGGSTYVDTSNVIDMNDDFRLTIKVNDGNTAENTSLIKAYAAVGTQLVDHTNTNTNTVLKAPVLGQGTTLSAYVNSPNATVKFGSTVATFKGQYEDTEFYLYQADSTWSGSYGERSVTITADYSNYTRSSQVFKVPVYHIVPGTSSVATSGQGTVSANKWYLFHFTNNAGSSSGYLYYDNNNYLEKDSNYDDYKYIMGFSSSENPLYIYNAKATLAKSIVGDSQGNTLKFQTGSTTWTQYNMYTTTRTEYTGIFSSKTITGLNFQPSTNSNLHWGFAGLLDVDETVSLIRSSAGTIVLYPISFKLTKE